MNIKIFTSAGLVTGGGEFIKDELHISSSSSDPEIKAFAAKTLEVLLIHQDSAKNIKDALGRQNN